MGETEMKKLASRKLALTILASIVPILCQVFLPDMPTEKIVVSVVGLLGGVWGLAKEDVAKLQAGVHESFADAKESTPEPKAEPSAEG